MSSHNPERAQKLQDLTAAARSLSDAIVLFHYAASEQLGLGPSDWKTLGILQLSGPLTAGELVSRTGLAPASVTGIIDRLRAGGWVIRERDTDDGRRVVVRLTDSASDIGRDELFGPLMTRLEALYAGYSDDELTFLASALNDVAAIQREATAGLEKPGRRKR